MMSPILSFLLSSFFNLSDYVKEEGALWEGQNVLDTCQTLASLSF